MTPEQIHWLTMTGILLGFVGGSFTGYCFGRAIGEVNGYARCKRIFRIPPYDKCSVCGAPENAQVHDYMKAAQFQHAFKDHME